MTKTVNYTEDQVTTMVSAYTAATNDAERAQVVKDMAEGFGKTINSIRAKLSREKVYVKKAATTKNGSTIVKKAELVENIAEALGVPSERVESLEKATKDVLELLDAAL